MYEVSEAIAPDLTQFNTLASCVELSWVESDRALWTAL